MTGKRVLEKGQLTHVYAMSEEFLAVQLDLPIPIHGCCAMMVSFLRGSAGRWQLQHSGGSTRRWQLKHSVGAVVSSQVSGALLQRSSASQGVGSGSVVLAVAAWLQRSSAAQGVGSGSMTDAAQQRSAVLSSQGSAAQLGSAVAAAQRRAGRCRLQRSRGSERCQLQHSGVAQWWHRRVAVAQLDSTMFGQRQWSAEALMLGGGLHSLVCSVVEGFSCFQFFTDQMQNKSWTIFVAEHILCNLRPDADLVQGDLRFTIFA